MGKKWSWYYIIIIHLIWKIGQLGIPQLSLVQTPTIVEIDPSVFPIKQISVSSTHTLILSQSGNVFAAGRNLYGELGIGNFTQKMDKFTQIMDISQVTQIVSTDVNSFAITRKKKNYINSI